MMKNLLDHMVAITAHTDRELIEAALAGGLRALSRAESCTIYGLAHTDGRIVLKQVAIARMPLAGTCLAEHPEFNHHAYPAQQEFPILDHCIRNGLSHATETNAAGQAVTWIPFWDGMNSTARACACLIGEKCPTMLELKHLDGMITVYRNFARLIDDNELDSLTGLLNRKTFDRRFSELIGSAATASVSTDPARSERRSAETITEHWLAVIDIDFFKKVNDQFGHVYGDEVLILMANILRTSFRDQDRVYRFGGEEFVVLLRSTSLADARKSFERLRARVQATTFPQINGITISLGFVSISQDTPVSILGHADQALYFAKENGRNQICFYDELVASGHLGGVVRYQEADFF